jgi:hypothetical protein
MSKLIRRGRKICFCAFCRTPHSVYERKGVGTGFVLGSILVTLSFMYGYWESWNIRSIPLFLTCLFVGEVLAHLRWRLALICRQCGFDPLVYCKSPERAAEQVRDFLDRRRSNPEYLLAPPIHLPKKIQKVPLESTRL